MDFEKFLGVGWDAAGMLGNKQAMAIYQCDPTDNSEIKFLGSNTFSFNDTDSSIPLDLEEFFHFHDNYSSDHSDWHKVLAIDSPFSFPSGFKQWVQDKDSQTLSDSGSSGGDRSKLETFFYDIGYRETDRYIQDKFKDRFSNSRPFSPVYSMITNQVILVKSHLNRWQETNQAIIQPKDGHSKTKTNVLEVYPKLLKEDGKSDGPVTEAYRSYLKDTSIEPGSDQYDAALCAIHALGYESGDQLANLDPLVTREEVLQQSDQWEFPPEEGWIYHFS